MKWHMRNSDLKKKDIFDLVQKIDAQNLVLVEIGSYMGESACLFAQSGKFKTIVCIDPWIDISGNDGNAYSGMTEVEKIFDANTALYPQIIKFKGTIDSFAVSDLFKNLSGVDVVYIDGLHTYEGCSHDISVCRDTIRPRLAFSGHDYTDKIAHVVGVKMAVDDAFGEPDAMFCDNSWIKFVK